MELSNEFKVRCGAIGQIMTNPRTKSETLSKTCITHLYEWIKSQPEYYGRHEGFRSKYCDKGNDCEAASIDFASNYYGWGFVTKNEELRENEYITGTCDVVLSNKIVDIKNSWSQDSFPLFDTEFPVDAYAWQGQGYMELWHKPDFELIYTLMDAPEYLIEREARSVAYKAGYDDVPAELYEDVKERMTYSNFLDDLRIKKFGMAFDKGKIEQVYERVELCRKFIKSL